MLNNTWMVRLAAAAGCASVLTSPVRAEPAAPAEVRRIVILQQGQQGQPKQVEVEVEAREGDARPMVVRRMAEVRSSSHWLGLECFTLDGPLRSHLGLREGEGLMIEQVVPDSPAAKAELKQHDVIVKAGGQMIKSVSELMKQVDEAKENELSLDIIRGGKAMTVKVTPAKRPETQDVLRKFRGGEGRTEELRGWIEQLQRGEQPPRIRVFGPGAVLPGGDKGLPKGLSVGITRSGGDPAKITVKRGEESWDVTEKELDKLPEDVRPHVERMLGRGVLALPGIPATPVMPPLPGVVPAAPLKPSNPNERRIEGTEKQMQQMMEQLEKLRNQMEELQRALPKEPKAPANDSRA